MTTQPAIVVRDDSTRADLIRAIGALRVKQLRYSPNNRQYLDIGAEIDDLLERLLTA